MFNKLRAYITAVKLEREINKIEREANQLIEDEIVARSILEIDARIAQIGREQTARYKDRAPQDLRQSTEDEDVFM